MQTGAAPEFSRNPQTGEIVRNTSPFADYISEWKSNPISINQDPGFPGIHTDIDEILKTHKLENIYRVEGTNGLVIIFRNPLAVDSRLEYRVFMGVPGQVREVVFDHEYQYRSGTGLAFGRGNYKISFGPSHSDLLMRRLPFLHYEVNEPYWYLWTKKVSKQHILIPLSVESPMELAEVGSITALESYEKGYKYFASAKGPNFRERFGSGGGLCKALRGQ
jgi:hypothetical protein